ncbi:MAG: hypothetical protein V4621_02910 [Pseudomonadota bacterium]
MLERVERILQTWEKEGVEAALALNLPMPDAQQFQSSLSTLTEDENRRLMIRLDDFATAIGDYQVHATAEMGKVLADLERAKSAASACVSYNKRHKDK